MVDLAQEATVPPYLADRALSRGGRGSRRFGLVTAVALTACTALAGAVGVAFGPELMAGLTRQSDPARAGHTQSPTERGSVPTGPPQVLVCFSSTHFRTATTERWFWLLDPRHGRYERAVGADQQLTDCLPSPDGRWALLLAASTDPAAAGEQTAVAVLDLRTGARRPLRLPTAAVSPRWSTDSRLFVSTLLRGGRALAQVTTVATGRSSAQPNRLPAGTGRYAYGPRPGQLVFQDERSTLYTLGPDGRVLDRQQVSWVLSRSGWSPDGSHLVSAAGDSPELRTGVAAADGGSTGLLPLAHSEWFAGWATGGRPLLAEPVGDRFRVRTADAGTGVAGGQVVEVDLGDIGRKTAGLQSLVAPRFAVAEAAAAEVPRIHPPLR